MKIIIILLASIILLTGCSTVAGVGKDIQSGGRTLENAAK